MCDVLVSKKFKTPAKVRWGLKFFFKSQHLNSISANGWILWLPVVILRINYSHDFFILTGLFKFFNCGS